MRILELPKGATARQWGLVHGETFREEIAEIGAIRLGLTARVGGFASEAEILELARGHMPVLESFDRDLYDEVVGIAQGAGVSEALVVVANHYTDLRDLGPSMTAEIEDDCTAVLSKTPEGLILGQTWDIHASASPYTLMIHKPADERAPEAWLFSITGCVGMTGLNAAGVAVTINNLKSYDACVGVLWPALVRRMLCETSAKGALDVLMSAPIGSGHHYVMADPHQCFAVETSGKLRRVIFDDPEGTLIHTNHCLDPVVGACSAVAPTSTTYERFEHMTQDVGARPVEGFDDMWARLATHEGYPRSICTHLNTPSNPHAVATCGGTVYDMAGRRLRAAAGCMVDNPNQIFTLDPL